MKASIARRLDQLRNDAPSIDAQWRTDRAGEKKRLKRLKRAVAGVLVLREAIKVAHRRYRSPRMPAPMKQILFLCTGNYYRSRFAEELFNHLAEATGLSWRATSRALAIERGSENIGPMSRFTIDALRERRITPAGASRMPEACTTLALERADLVIAVKEAEHLPLMTERHPGWETKTRFWHVHDVEDGPPDEALDQLDQLVRSLVVELRAQGPPR